MDSPAPVAAWLVLAVALLALGVVAAGLLLGRRGTPAVEPPSPPPDRPAGRRWAQDDLPGFLESPPGTPAADDPGPGPPEPAAPGPAGPDPSGRTVAGLAAAALALVAVLAAVAGTTRGGEAPLPGGPATPPAPRPPAATAAPPTTAPPDLPPVPADPLPGERGAGALAARSVPLGDDGATARLALGGLVLERRAVGVTVTYPSVSVTVGGGEALAHVLLPTWNCLGDAAPADPEQAGCTRAGVEYADLPTPALEVSRDGDALRLTGRFPTYTRPSGTPPVYTGRVYPLSVTVAPAGPLRDGQARAEGALFLGTDRAGSLPDPSLSRIRVVG
ncbi:hypothetical protein SAMN05660690_0364 [Geodermatophilus telluris]|uniref:Uncharacterized protein n=1 Tax=Geodermatophilus telluris TaxID=1190417 RepID=A0A1G6IG31_9ACTN|nr:hypothetical protein [Geodermatophilus telluris]SDC05479.1 hypothetical protein SAMN05660690_0364 [Geodermatophilus telluris]